MSQSLNLAPILSLALALSLTGGGSPAWAERSAVTREDLARSYQRFERAREEAGATSPLDLKTLNRGFDQATLAFFSGRQDTAIQQLDRLSDALWSGRVGLRSSFAARLAPRRWVRGTQPPELSLTPLYASQAAPARATLALCRAGSDEVLRRVELELRPNLTVVSPGHFLSDLEPGDYRIRLLQADAPWIEVGRCALLPETPAAALERLSALAKLPDAPQSAGLAWRDRCALLTLDPSPDSTAEVLSDPNALLSSLEAEARALGEGRDPYAGRAGSYWRTFSCGQARAAVRVIAPEPAGAPPAGRPLVVALHGAGGDENMFGYAYGRGILGQLALAKGAIVICPRSEVLLRDPASFDALVAAVSASYPVDSSRVYLLGHSLGAMAAARILPNQAGKVAAAFLFAGAARSEQPPVRALRGQIDPLGFGGGGAEVVPDYGHTLLVGDRMAEALDWLWMHKLAGPTWF